MVQQPTKMVLKQVTAQETSRRRLQKGEAGGIILRKGRRPEAGFFESFKKVNGHEGGTENGITVFG